LSNRSFIVERPMVRVFPLGLREKLSNGSLNVGLIQFCTGQLPVGNNLGQEFEPAEFVLGKIDPFPLRCRDPALPCSRRSVRNWATNFAACAFDGKYLACRFLFRTAS
jgi:hypothetical protein